jgi:cation diffusion facilitator family transporter
MSWKQRAGSAERGALVSVCGLLGLTLFKGIAGWLTGSKALMADACHTAADCAGAFTTYLERKGLRKSIAQTRRTETVTSIVLSALLVLFGLEMALSSVRAAVSDTYQAPGWNAVAFVALGAFIRGVLIRIQHHWDARLGIRAAGQRADRASLAATLIAFAGASFAAAGIWAGMPALYLFDPAAGLIVSAIVVWSGCKFVGGILRQQEQSACCDVDLKVIQDAIDRIDGVVSVGEVRAREQGHYVVVDAVIHVNPRISVAEGQEIALRVKRHLTKRFLHIADVLVHVQPYDPGFPYKTNHVDEPFSTLVQ